MRRCRRRERLTWYVPARWLPTLRLPAATRLRPAGAPLPLPVGAPTARRLPAAAEPGPRWLPAARRPAGPAVPASRRRRTAARPAGPPRRLGPGPRARRPARGRRPRPAATATGPAATPWSRPAGGPGPRRCSSTRIIVGLLFVPAWIALAPARPRSRRARSTPRATSSSASPTTPLRGADRRHVGPGHRASRSSAFVRTLLYWGIFEGKRTPEPGQEGARHPRGRRRLRPGRSGWAGGSGATSPASCPASSAASATCGLRLGPAEAGWHDKSSTPSSSRPDRGRRLVGMDLTTVADDEVVLHDAGRALTLHGAWRPTPTTSSTGVAARTLPRPARRAAGHVLHGQRRALRRGRVRPPRRAPRAGPSTPPPRARTPYPVVMNRAAVADMAAVGARRRGGQGRPHVGGHQGRVPAVPRHLRAGVRRPAAARAGQPRRLPRRGLRLRGPAAATCRA